MKHYVALVSRVGIVQGQEGPIYCSYCFTDGSAYWRTDREVEAWRRRWNVRILRPNHRILVSLEIDHVVPLFRGGEHDESNMVFACARCNGSKSYKLLSEWGGPLTIRPRKRRASAGLW